MPHPDLTVLYEHPEWQKPLFAALENRKIPFARFDLKRAVFDVDETPKSRLFFNQASPSAYVRGNKRAVPLALSYIRSLETAGAKVLNGSAAFSLELSKSVQGTLLKKLGIAHPKTLAFNDLETVRSHWDRWPALLKPEQGGSGARMFLLQSYEELVRTVEMTPDIWTPDNLLMLQEYFPVDPSHGIVRMEYLGGELLYAMRVVSHGSFNLCPSEVCHPTDGGESACEIPTTKPVEFHAYKEVPAEAVAEGAAIAKAGSLDVCGIEYLVAADGRRIFYDINANSNLRPAVAKEFGFDPFERVVDFLARNLG